MENDELGDADVAKQVAAEVEGAELFLYPGDRHLVTDSSLPGFDPEVAARVTRRVQRFL